MGKMNVVWEPEINRDSVDRKVDAEETDNTFPPHPLLLAQRVGVAPNAAKSFDCLQLGQNHQCVDINRVAVAIQIVVAGPSGELTGAVFHSEW